MKSPRLHRRDRIFWIWLSRLSGGGRSILFFVQPETIFRWHLEGLRLYWRWKSRKRRGRPELDAEIRTSSLDAVISRLEREADIVADEQV